MAKDCITFFCFETQKDYIYVWQFKRGSNEVRPTQKYLRPTVHRPLSQMEFQFNHVNTPPSWQINSLNARNSHHTCTMECRSNPWTIAPIWPSRRFRAMWCRTAVRCLWFRQPKQAERELNEKKIYFKVILESLIYSWFFGFVYFIKQTQIIKKG